VIEPDTLLETQRPGLLRTSARGAKAGLRRTSYVAGPIVVLAMIPGLALSALGVGAGRGWPIMPGYGVPPILYRPIGFYLACAFFGLMMGAFLGLIRGMILRARSGTLVARLWAAANRPIRPFGGARAEVSTAGPAPPVRRCRLWRQLLGVPTFLVLLATVAGFGTGVYLGKMVDARLDAAISAADRDDPFWRWDDLLDHREVVPDDENSAFVVAEALESVPEGWPVPRATIPGRPSPPPSEAAKAIDRLAEMPENVRLDDASAGAIHDELDKYREAIEIARTVADYRRSRHELVPGPLLIDTLLPETQASRTAARLLAADAAMRAHDGDIDGALDSCRAIIGVGRSIGDEPFLISQLVRAAIGTVAKNTARRILAQGEPSNAHLGRLQALLLDERTQPLFAIGMGGERAGLDELIRRIGTGEIAMDTLGRDVSKADLGTLRGVVFPWGKLMYDNQRAVALEWMNEAVRISRQPVAARQPLWKTWDANIVRVRNTRFASTITSTLPVFMTPATSNADRAQGRYQAALGAATILLAAERHRRKAGDWPKSIAAIDPAILPSPPLDPYTGEAYVVERRDGQFLIHSVGPNGRDDHGVPTDWKRMVKDGADDIGTGAWDVPLRRRPSSAPDSAAGRRDG
jgi:hypothetical protein